MAKYGYPEKFITIVRQFHEGMHARVQENGESSVAFPVTNEVEQGCVQSPTLFSIMFSATLSDAFNGSGNGTDIRYCTDGSVFNLWKLKAKTKVKTDIVNKCLFTYDCALKTATKANLQNSVDKFSMACDNFGLTINTKKTEVMHQPAPGKTHVKPNITIKGQRLKVVEKFTYRSITLSLSSWMTRWTSDSQKQGHPLADSTGMCRIGEAYRRQPKYSYTELSFLPPSLWLWNVDNLSTAYKEAKPLHHPR